jgi:hypothetical protein
MFMESIHALANLLRKRNEIDAQITRLIGRPATQGHIGEFIAATVFDIELMSLANNKAIDGHFRTGPLAGKSVDFKFYGKQEGILDIKEHFLPDYFLVLTGPRSPAGSSRAMARLCVINHVYLFDACRVAREIARAGLKFGVAASVRAALWEEAEVYPTHRTSALELTDSQRSLLQLFGEAC